MSNNRQPARRLSFIATGLLLLVVAVPTGSSASPPSDDPPRDVRDALATIRRLTSTADDRRAALQLLAADAEAEPYLRAALNATVDQTDRNALRAALISNQNNLFDANLDRAKKWAKELRFDYLTELTTSTDDEKRANVLGELVVAAQIVVHDRYKDIGYFGAMGKPPPAWNFVFKKDFAAFANSKRYRRFSGDRVEILKDYPSPMFIHATSGSLAPIGGQTWVCLSGVQLEEITPPEGVSWHASVICVNDGARFGDVYRSLIICDGDISFGLPTSCRCSGSVIVANGDVAIENYSINSYSYVFAAGNFSGGAELFKYQSSIIAGGKNSSIPPADNPMAKYFKEGVKENPLGIKFVSPADAGIELGVKTEEVRLAALTKDSPLRVAGLEPGDRVVKLNGLAMKTASDFRRQLRPSLLWGSGLFEIRRGNETFLRLVKFPVPLAANK